MPLKNLSTIFIFILLSSYLCSMFYKLTSKFSNTTIHRVSDTRIPEGLLYCIWLLCDGWSPELCWVVWQNAWWHGASKCVSQIDSDIYIWTIYLSLSNYLISILSLSNYLISILSLSNYNLISIYLISLLSLSNDLISIWSLSNLNLYLIFIVSLTMVQPTMNLNSFGQCHTWGRHNPDIQRKCIIHTLM